MSKFQLLLIVWVVVVTMLVFNHYSKKNGK
jgi:hypothetical protein